MKKREKIGTFIMGILMAAWITLSLSSCSERIDAGHEGLLVKSYGSEKGVQDVILATGRVWYNPITEDVVENPLFVQTLDYPPFTVDAKGGGTFTIDPTISINAIQGRTPQIYVKYRLTIPEVLKTTGYNTVKDAYRIEFNKHDLDWVVNNREQLETNVETLLRAEFELEGFSLNKLTHGLQYPEAIKNAIDAKNMAYQKALQVETNLKQAKAQAEIDLVQARTKSEMNKLENTTITDNLIKMKFIEKWDGSAPLYGAAPVMFKSVN